MPALLLALCCAAALVALGDLRVHTWPAIGLLLAWGGLVLVLHQLDLDRAARGRGWLDVRRLSPGAVFAAAALVRGVLLLAPPTLSDDLYRYMWEGWSTLHGGNPYAVPPALAGGALDHPVRALVNHPEVSTIYPPVAMWGFALLASLGMHTAVFQAAMGLADAAVAAVLADVLRGRGRSTGPAWLYAVLPLGAVESAGSGHMEPWGVLCLVLAIRAWDRGRSGLGWAGLGALVKLLPVVILPALWRRQPWLLLLLALLGLVATLPFLDAGPALLRGFTTYAERWSFNGGGFRLLALVLDPLGLPPAGIRLVAVGLGAAVCLLALARFRDPARVALWAGAAFVLLSPTVHPWYLVWVLVPALIRGVRAWNVLAVLAPLSYAALASYDPSTSTWQEPTWPPIAQYLPLSLVLIHEWWRHWTRPGPWLPPPRPSTPSPEASRSASPT